MRRRNFLQMLGAAVAAPAMPAIAAPTAQVATYNRYMYGLGVFHARTRAHISAKGLAFRLKISTAQAELMIGEMTSKGLVTPVMSATGGKVRAVSNILKPDVWGLERTQVQARKAGRDAKRARAQQADAKMQNTPDLTDMISHLRQLCRDYGMALRPRAATAGATV